MSVCWVSMSTGDRRCDVFGCRLVIINRRWMRCVRCGAEMPNCRENRERTIDAAKREAQGE